MRWVKLIHQRVAKLLTAFALAVCVCGAQAADTLSKSAGVVRRATVAVQAKYVGSKDFETIGTGWLYKNQDTVVTARHVATADGDEPPIQEFRVQFLDGKFAHVDKIAAASGADLAVMDLVDADVKDAKRPTLKLAGELPEFGEEVFTIGCPDGQDEYLFHLTVGRVSNDRSPGYLVNSAQLIPGNSGGALCDERGRVVGVVVSVDLDFATINFAVELKSLKEWLDPLVAVTKEKGGVAPPPVRS